MPHTRTYYLARLMVTGTLPARIIGTEQIQKSTCRREKKNKVPSQELRTLKKHLGEFVYDTLAELGKLSTKTRTDAQRYSKIHTRQFSSTRAGIQGTAPVIEKVLTLKHDWIDSNECPLNTGIII